MFEKTAILQTGEKASTVTKPINHGDVTTLSMSIVVYFLFVFLQTTPTKTRKGMSSEKCLV